MGTNFNSATPDAPAFGAANGPAGTVTLGGPIASGSNEFLAQIKYPEVSPRVFEMDAVVSRKKQLLPHLVHCLAEMQRG